MSDKTHLEIDNLWGQEVIRIKAKNETTWFSFLPHYGGAMNEWVVKGKSILEGTYDAATFESRTQQSFAGTQLFPFPNRIKGGVYTFNEQGYELETNDPVGNNALHGLVYDQQFDVLTLDEAQGLVQLIYDYDAWNEGYPFKFKLVNTYKLLSDRVEISTQITNRGQATIPLGHGWHPYFSIGEDISDMQLQVAAEFHYPIDDTYIPSGELEKYDQFIHLTPVGDTELNHCFKINEGSKELASLYFPTQDLTVKVVSEDYPFLQVYTPASRRSIALEPQTCAPNVFNNGIGLLTLAPNESIELKLRLLILQS